MIRLIICLIAIIIVTVASLFLYPVYLLIKKLDRKKGDYFAFGFVRFGLRLTAFLCGASAEYKGLEYLPEDGDAVVFIGNHRSIFDLILTYPVFKGLTGPIAKKEFEHYPLIGWWVTSIYGIFLDRNDTRQGLKCILQGIDQINSGVSMLIFPEGKRGHAENELLPFHAGSFKLATKPQVRIIPIAISGTGAIFDDHRPVVRSHRAVIEFCEPIETKGLSREELIALPDRVHDIILEKIRANYPEVK